jgi:predicted ATPase/DNA-binding CsgD family transcriptional regulator
MAQVASRDQVTGSRRPGPLPAEVTSFVGRTTELAGITALLGTSRMVTVVGSAGVGKTRTSLYAAAQLAGQYPDGIRYADLAGVSDPGAVASAVAAALGLRDSGEPDIQAAVLSHLQGRKLLLILDTCEHLVDACAAFADTVLHAAAGVTLLATSRQPLDAPGEHAFPLLPLPAETDAVRLFAERAESVVPGFTVTPRNRADVVRVCRRLDGIPLAVELAAVRLRALPLPELASQLESGIRTLTVSRRGTSPRHQTLRAAVEWSYQLCTPAERALWQRLSVFPETFDVSGAEQVGAGGILPREQVVHALVGLVDKSVVLRNGADPSRYRMLSALREFGADRRAEADDGERALDRLTTRSLALARDFDEQFRNGARSGGSRSGGGQGTRGHAAGGGTSGAQLSPSGGAPSQAAAFRRLHAEYASVRAALGYALAPLEAPDAAAGSAGAAAGAARPARWRLGADLAVRLCGYWQVSGLLDEGRRWLGDVIRLFPEPARERAWALGARGYLAALQGDPDSALADINESIRLAAAAGIGAENAVTRGYLQLNLALTLAGRPAEAAAAGEEARQRLAGGQHPAGLLTLETQLALLQVTAGDTDAALARCDRGLALLRAPGQERWISGYLSVISGVALAQCPGREQAAALALRRGLAALHELGDVLGTAYAVEALAWLAGRRGQHERAAWLLGTAGQLREGRGPGPGGVALLVEFRQHTASAARTTLGERRYTAAYAHGAALKLDAVIADVADASGGLAAVPGDGADPGNAAGAALAALTRREREIAELVASGLSNREIAVRLFISKRTVDAHVEHIFAKLEISSRVQLTVLLRQPARLGRVAAELAATGNSALG